MDAKIKISILALILLLLLINYFENTGEITVRISGTCTDKCCFIPPDILSAKKIDCVEKYIPENPSAVCSNDLFSMNSNCRCMTFISSHNIKGAEGKGGCISVQKALKDKDKTKILINKCYKNRAINYGCQSYGRNCGSNIDNCDLQKQKCVINGDGIAVCS